MQATYCICCQALTSDTKCKPIKIFTSGHKVVDYKHYSASICK